MPMLALLLLCAGWFGADADGADAALRSQILQADAGHAGAQPALDRAAEPTGLQLYRLRQDRVLRLGQQRLPHDGQAQPAGPVRFVQVWERVDGHWRLQRMVSIDAWVAQR
ncbi:hypothetical protein [uncultured Stenotrophomonas sp.]|uniref:hypothetical protein n=1 Tax=uncultured Stenotrophomonas sp. TaxID=165438 RepID=UPI0025EB9DA4|nr:hypothetical protein [uncultured Stenotrophomonas sp.]